MKYLYDSASNSLVVTFVEGRAYGDSDEIANGVVVDYDTDGRPTSIEFLRASDTVDVSGLISGRPVRLLYGAYTGPDELTGESLKAWRESVGIAADQLATYLSVPLERLDAWEKGERQIEYPGLLRLALETVEGSLHRQFVRQVLDDFRDSLQDYVVHGPPREPSAQERRR